MTNDWGITVQHNAGGTMSEDEIYTNTVYMAVFKATHAGE